MFMPDFSEHSQGHLLKVRSKQKFFLNFQKNCFLLLFVFFLCSFLNVEFLSLVTKLPSCNYYRRENQNTGVKDLYEKK